MSACDNSNIRQNYIVTGTEQDILSACTAIYTNQIYNCDGNTVFVQSPQLSANNIVAQTLTACDGIWTSNIYGCSPITVQDQLKLNVVSNNDTLDRILVIDDITGLIEYRNLSTITSGSSITNFSYNNRNTFTITRNDGSQFSASFNIVTGLTINGNLLVTGNTEVTGNITPTNDGVSDIGLPIKRFRNINTISGTSTVWTSTNQVITPNLNLGLDSNNELRIITADNSVIQNDILIGGTY